MKNIDLPGTYPTNAGDQKKAVLKAFAGAPKTMLCAAAISGVMRSSICWYFREFRRNNQIEFVGFGICPITKHKAGFYRRRGEKCSK